MKLLVLTDTSKILGCDGKLLYTSVGNIELTSVECVLSYRYIPLLKKLRKPTVVVSKESVELLFMKECPKISRKEAKKLLLRNYYMALEVAKRVAPSFEFRKPELLRGALSIERLLTNTFYGFLSLYTGLYREFGYALCRKIDCGNEKLRLMEILLLPVVSYCVLSEVDKVLGEGLDSFRDGKECINTCLSYVMSGERFSFLLTKSLEGARNLIVRKPDLAQTHGGLSSHSRKLRKAKKPQNPLPLFLR